MDTTIRKTARRIAEGTEGKAATAFDLVVQGLILLSLVTFALDTLPNLSERTREWLYRFEVITVIVFSMEYVLRLWVAENPFRYATSFYGIVDLMAVAPFYIASGIDLRSVRVLRLLRLARILKLGRYNRAMQRIGRALQMAREEIGLFFFVSVLLLYLSAVGIYYFEGEVQPDKFGSVFHALWWSVCTLTTVGYGDAVPITVGGRIFTFLVLLIGLGIVAVPAGILSAALSQVRLMESEHDRP